VAGTGGEAGMVLGRAAGIASLGKERLSVKRYELGSGDLVPAVVRVRQR
jgi:hypothetical protein